MGYIIDLITHLLSGGAHKSIQTQHTSVVHTLPQFWKRQSCHPSRLGNMLSSIHLGNSALNSERLQGDYITQRACVHTQKILGSPLGRLCTVLMLCLWQSVKNPLSGPGKSNTKFL